MPPAFRPSEHGFPFGNCFPPGPVLTIPTPFGRFPIGNAAGGVCGGMVYAACDLHVAGRAVPAEATPTVFGYLCRRLMVSFDIPFGVLKYYDWQRRPDDSGWVQGVSFLTITREWPRIRARLDAGRTAPLGVIKVRSWDPRQLGKNHQVLAYAYDFTSTDELVIQIYDPNCPKDDDATLQLNLRDPMKGRPVYHSREGPSIRGFFLTRYQRPWTLPAIDW